MQIGGAIQDDDDEYATVSEEDISDDDAEMKDWDKFVIFN